MRSFYKSKDAECSVEIDFSKKKKKNQIWKSLGLSREIECRG